METAKVGGRPSSLFGASKLRILHHFLARARGVDVREYGADVSAGALSLPPLTIDRLTLHAKRLLK